MKFCNTFVMALSWFRKPQKHCSDPRPRNSFPKVEKESSILSSKWHDTRQGICVLDYGVAHSNPQILIFHSQSTVFHSTFELSLPHSPPSYLKSPVSKHNSPFSTLFHHPRSKFRNIHSRGFETAGLPTKCSACITCDVLLAPFSRSGLALNIIPKEQLLARACGVLVGQHSGSRQATTLVAIKNDIIFSLFFFSFLFSFLIEGELESKNLFRESWREHQKT